MFRKTFLGVVLSAIAFAPAATATPHTEKFHADFSGFNEVGALNAQSGAIFSPGHGMLELWLDRVNQTLSFALSFSDLSAPVTQSHIHFGKNHMAGAVMVFFCSNLATAPAGRLTTTRWSPMGINSRNGPFIIIGFVRLTRCTVIEAGWRQTVTSSTPGPVTRTGGSSFVAQQTAFRSKVPWSTARTSQKIRSMSQGK